MLDRLALKEGEAIMQSNRIDERGQVLDVIELAEQLVHLPWRQRSGRAMRICKIVAGLELNTEHVQEHTVSSAHHSEAFGVMKFAVQSNLEATILVVDDVIHTDLGVLLDRSLTAQLWRMFITIMQAFYCFCLLAS